MKKRVEIEPLEGVLVEKHIFSDRIKLLENHNVANCIGKVEEIEIKGGRMFAILEVKEIDNIPNYIKDFGYTQIDSNTIKIMVLSVPKPHSPF